MSSVLQALRARLGALPEVWRTVTETLVALIVLAVVGAVLGPQWDPVPLDSTLQLGSTSTAITGAPALGSYLVRQSVVTVRLDGTSVQARISEPVGAPGNRRAVVFVHGAGTGRYQDAFVAQAYALAATGVVAMVPDKRLDTYSTTHRDYVAMAADYERSVDLLRSWPGVDPAQVGLYAESEGCWIAPVMAAGDPRLAFVVLASSPVVPPRQQAAFAVDNYLRNTHVPSEVFRAIPRAVGLSAPGAFGYADFDVSPYQQGMRQPVLVAYGTADASMPLVQGAEQIISDTAVAGNDQVTVRYYAGADHGLKVDGVVSPGFLRDLAGWVLGLPATAAAAPQVAGAAAVQQFRADPVPTPRWLRDSDLLLGLVLGAGVALAVALVLVVGDRVLVVVRRRRASATGSPVRVTGIARPVAGPLLGCAAGCVATVAALVWYLLAVARLALDYERNTVVVTGGWVGVRLLGVITVLFGVVALRRSAAVRRQARRGVVGLLPRVAVTVAVLACAALLVVLAYWGVFQLGI